MKIAVGQINPRIADFEYNFSQMEEFAEKAAEQGCNLIIFPELSLCGYMPEDLIFQGDFLKKTEKYLSKIEKLSEKISLICGYVKKNTGKGKPFFNTAGMFVKGELVAEYNKRLLPTYDVFNEKRYFEEGDSPAIFELDGIKLGITICEDGWNTEFSPAHGLYPVDPIKETVEAGCHIVLNIAASPFYYKKVYLREKMFSNIAANYRKPLIFINFAGGIDGVIFDGDSCVYNANGEIVVKASRFKQDLIVWDTENDKNGVKPVEEEHNKLIFDALTLGVKDFIRKIGAKKVHLGLSGGIDSALVAVIAKYALGKENVTGIMLPSPYSSEESIKDSVELTENLGIKVKKIEITPYFEQFKKLLPAETGELNDITEQNIQARLRGLILMAYSNNTGSILLNTGNKSELAVGYATMYGDMCGALSVIGDLYKTKVYSLAEWINEKFGNIIPENIITKEPSAELKPGQKDSDSLPPYPVLDAILERYLEECKSVSNIERETGFDGELIAKVVNMVNRFEYKRKQGAPVLKLTAKAFKTGFRFPLTSNFRLKG